MVKKKQSLSLRIFIILIVFILFCSPIPHVQTSNTLCMMCPYEVVKCPRCPQKGDITWTDSIAARLYKITAHFGVKNELQMTVPSEVMTSGNADCGIYPDEVFAEIRKQVGDLTKSGPTWSSDCKHVAWSQRKVPRDGLATDENGDIKSVSEKPELNKFEGVYLYDVRSKKTVRIYEPGEPLTRPSFDRWIDNNTLQYYVYGTTQIYSLR